MGSLPEHIQGRSSRVKQQQTPEFSGVLTRRKESIMITVYDSLGRPHSVTIEEYLQLEQEALARLLSAAKSDPVL